MSRLETLLLQAWCICECRVWNAALFDLERPRKKCQSKGRREYVFKPYTIVVAAEDVNFVWHLIFEEIPLLLW